MRVIKSSLQFSGKGQFISLVDQLLDYFSSRIDKSEKTMLQEFEETRKLNEATVYCKCRIQRNVLPVLNSIGSC